LDPSESIIGSHSVSFFGVDEAAEELEFQNSHWGSMWGNNGIGQMPFDYFDTHLIEAFACFGIGYTLAGYTGETLGTMLSLVGAQHGMVMYGSADDSVRYGWAMFTETSDEIHVDDLYVRPEYRGRKWGERLWKKLLGLSHLYRKPLRFWIPFSDCEPDHLEFLRKFFGKRGYAILPSTVGWAACEVRPGTMAPTLPKVSLPERPAMPLAAVAKRLAAALALGMSNPEVSSALRLSFPPDAPVSHVNGAEEALTEKSVHFLTELDSYTSLPMSWNGYSAPVPSIVAIRNAKALVIESNRTSVPPQRVEPSAMGGVGITFAADPREVVVEFYNDGTAHALFSDDATGEMHTKSVSLDPSGYEEQVKDIRKYLHGE